MPAPMPLVLRRLQAVLALAFVFTMSVDAQAFERQWHLGGGLGAVLPAGEYSLGPALGAHAAYGISDVFDVRLELVGSRHTHDIGPAVNSFSAAAGLAYKLDVIEWVPYAGALAGYTYADPEIEPSELGPHRSPTLGFILGLDYGFSRSFGLGACFREDFLLVGGGAQATFLLRAEHRWGW